MSLLLIGSILISVSLLIGYFLVFLAIRNIGTTFRFPNESFFTKHLVLVGAVFVAGSVAVAGFGCIAAHFIQKLN